MYDIPRIPLKVYQKLSMSHLAILETIKEQMRLMMIILVTIGVMFLLMYAMMNM